MADKVQSMVKDIMSESENVLNRALDNPYISTALKVFLGLYAAFAAPQLPKSIANLMDHTLVRIAFAFVIVFMATRDPSLALMIAVAFIITLQTANKFRLYDTSLSQAAPGQVSWLPSVSGNTVQQEQSQVEQPVMNQALEHPEEVSQELITNEQPKINDQATMNQSLLSENLNQVVEGMEGATTPESVQHAANVPQTAVFTSESQFTDAQNNNVPGTNQESCVKSWNNQHCIQGLENNSPNGFSGLEHSDF